MLNPAHKDLFAALARRHIGDLRASLHLARAHVSEDHLTVRRLLLEMNQAEEALRTLETEPARQVA